MIVPSIGIIQGVGKVVDYIKVFFSAISEWFDNLPLINIWESFYPNDISAVIELVIVLLLSLAVIGIIRKLLVIFG